MEETLEPAKETTKEAERAKFIAIVEMFAGPNEPRKVQFVSTRTKVEMTKELADPAIANVVGVLRGRHIDFKVTRRVEF
jgi:hypothetical protein